MFLCYMLDDKASERQLEFFYVLKFITMTLLSLFFAYRCKIKVDLLMHQQAII